MHILLLETSGPVCSAAIANDGRIISLREVNEGYSHAARLTVFVSEILEEAGLKLKDIDAFAVSEGPGSYTGLRIGVSVAKGLCYAVDKPLISVSTLESLARGAQGKIPDAGSEAFLFPMIDARRMEVYCALFTQKGSPARPPEALVIDEHFDFNSFSGKRVFYFGDGAEKCRSVLDKNKSFQFLEGVMPSSVHMAAIAAEKFSSGKFENLSLFEPFYLKEFNSGASKK